MSLGAGGEQSAHGRVRVKICGLTRPEDAVAAESAGADAIGMIFAPSKRRLELAAAAEIVAAVGPFVTTVGVFRDAPLETVLDTLGLLRLEVAQLHGAEDARYVAAVRQHARVLKAYSYSEAPEPALLRDHPADAFLLDGPRPGSGERYAWQAVAAWRRHPRLVLAGGLDPENVAEAVATMRPYAVDVASGVERTAGVKDHVLVRRFIEQVRAGERSASPAAQTG